MNTDHPKIAIVGAGAVGGYYGARLAQNGSDVHFLMRTDYDHVLHNGFTIRSVDGDFHLPGDSLHIYQHPDEMPKADLIIVTLKTTANALYQPLIASLLKPDSAILTLQNGLGNESELANLFGAERVMGGMAFVCINRLEPGSIHHMDHGVIKIGEYQGGPSPRVCFIADLFKRSNIACKVLDDLNYGRWEKLVWNIPFNGLGALLDLSTDRLIDNEDGLHLVRKLMQEVIDAFQANDVAFDENLIQMKIDQTQTMGKYKTSMQIDHQMGRSMEIEAIIGEPLRHARKVGISTPYLSMLYHQLKLTEKQRNVH